MVVGPIAWKKKIYMSEHDKYNIMSLYKQTVCLCMTQDLSLKQMLRRQTCQ